MRCVLCEKIGVLGRPLFTNFSPKGVITVSINPRPRLGACPAPSKSVAKEYSGIALVSVDVPNGAVRVYHNCKNLRLRPGTYHFVPKKELRAYLDNVVLAGDDSLTVIHIS